MPGLKGSKKTEQRSADTTVGLNNMLAVMEKREQTALPCVSESAKSAFEESEAESIPVSVVTPEESVSAVEGMLYATTFATVGSNTRNRYETGRLPRIHKLLLDAIADGIGAAGKGYLPLNRILQRLEISSTISIRILSCLEYYGYLRIRREAHNKARFFEVLKTA